MMTSIKYHEHTMLFRSNRVKTYQNSGFPGLPSDGRHPSAAIVLLQLDVVLAEGRDPHGDVGDLDDAVLGGEDAISGKT